jgi:hypothetical protein
VRDNTTYRLADGSIITFGDGNTGVRGLDYHGDIKLNLGGERSTSPHSSRSREARGSEDDDDAQNVRCRSDQRAIPTITRVIY